MTKRLPAAPAPGPLEDYAARFDDLFATLAQRQAFRRYLQGLLLPAERNKTLTALPGQHRAGGWGATQGSAGPAVVPLGVHMGPRGSKPAQGGTDARRPQDGPKWRRRPGHRRDG